MKPIEQREPVRRTTAREQARDWIVAALGPESAAGREVLAGHWDGPGPIEESAPRRVLGPQWFRHPGARLRPRTTNADDRPTHATIEAVWGGELAGSTLQPKPGEVARALRATAPSDREREWVAALLIGVDAKEDGHHQLATLQYEENLTTEELARAARTCGCTRAKISWWLNEQAAPKPGSPPSATTSAPDCHTGTTTRA